jgi:hypothetical protein
MPFVVGAPRSGTTLLRLMLDAHPQMAIPAETGFFITLGNPRESGALPASAADLVQLLTEQPNWVDFTISRQDFGRAVADLRPFTVGEAVRTFFRLYAKVHGKVRFGDKSPLHCYHLPLIQETLPEAHIIHIIRDGRDAAASLRDVWFSPGRDPALLADYWAGAVLAGKEGGASCTHYLEVRYEDLVRNPRETLHVICNYLELPFSERMLAYYLTAQERLSEAGDRTLKDGKVITLEQRLQQQRMTTFPPEQQRIGRWHEVLSNAEVREFEARAGGLLRDLGYELSDSELSKA